MRPILRFHRSALATLTAALLLSAATGSNATGIPVRESSAQASIRLDVRTLRFPGKDTPPPREGILSVAAAHKYLAYIDNLELHGDKCVLSHTQTTAHEGMSAQWEDAIVQGNTVLSGIKFDAVCHLNHGQVNMKVAVSSLGAEATHRTTSSGSLLAGQTYCFTLATKHGSPIYFLVTPTVYTPEG